MKLKKSKSAYATGAPPCPVTIEGGSKFLNASEKLQEYNGLLIVLAAILEQNNGRVIVPIEAINTVKKQKRILQLRQSEFGLSLQFDTFQEETAVPQVQEEKHFLESSVAQEARDFLAQQRKTNDTI
jgi:hypothetical protein